MYSVEPRVYLYKVVLGLFYPKLTITTRANSCFKTLRRTIHTKCSILLLVLYSLCGFIVACAFVCCFGTFVWYIKYVVQCTFCAAVLFFTILLKINCFKSSFIFNLLTHRVFVMCGGGYCRFIGLTSVLYIIVYEYMNARPRDEQYNELQRDHYLHRC